MITYCTRLYMGNITVSNLMYDLQKYFLYSCCTVSCKAIVPCKTDVNKLGTSPVSFKQCRQSSSCEVLMLDMTEKCANCD